MRIYKRLSMTVTCIARCFSVIEVTYEGDVNENVDRMLTRKVVTIVSV